MITKMFRFHLFNDKLLKKFFKQSDEESKKYI